MAMPTDRREFLGVGFDALSLEGVLQWLSRGGASTPLQYVVTPNVDHLVRLHEDSDSEGRLGFLYDEADLCLCDSRILHLLGRIRGVRLPVVPGSELTACIFDRLITKGDRIAIVGGDAELLSALQERYPGVEFVQHCPPMGLQRNAAARTVAAEFVARAHARFSFLAVGSPQQEMIAAEAKAMGDGTGIALCVGASLDFLTGREKRAPRSLQRFGLEWAHRLLSNPRRMWRRYLIDDPRIFLLACRWGPGRTAGAAK